MATNINIKNLPTGYQSLITNGKHAVVGDEPIKSKGTDLGFSPEDFILSSLAMCKVATVRYIARKNKWDHLINDVDADLSMSVKRGNGGHLTTTVDVAIHIDGDITAEQKSKLLAEADKCYIHRMIEGDWQINNAVEKTVETV